MPTLPFDATITLADRHLDAVGLNPRQNTDAAVAAVRGAVERMEGAGWMDVMAADFPPACAGWVTLYPCGSSITPDIPLWHAQRHQVEEVVKAALIAAAMVA